MRRTIWPGIAIVGLALATVLVLLPGSELNGASLPRIGVYNGNPWESPDEKTIATFGSVPQIASTYYRPDSRVNMAYETERIKRGTAPLLTLTLKSGTPSLEDVANRTASADAEIDKYIAALKTLSEVDASVPVYATLQHEFEVKYKQEEITDVTPQQYAAALSYFLERTHAEAPAVVTLYWFGGADTSAVATVLDALTVRPKAYAADPYRYGSPDKTLDESLGGIVTWLRTRIPDARVGFAEFGTDSALGDESNAVWMTGLRAWGMKNDIDFMCLFNRDSETFGFNIDDQRLTKKAFADELKQ